MNLQEKRRRCIGRSGVRLERRSLNFVPQQKKGIHQITSQFGCRFNGKKVGGKITEAGLFECDGRRL